MFCVTLAGSAAAQSGDLWTTLKDKYPDEPIVYIERSETLNLSVKDDSLYAYADVFEDVLHLKEQTTIAGSKRVYGSYFREIKDLKAKTLVWEKNKYKDFPVTEIKKKFDEDNDVFYDDSYYYAFSYPAIAARNRTQLEYRDVIKDARFITGFIFASYLPQAKTKYTIRTTGDVEIFFQVYNDPDNKISFKKSGKGNNVTYEWYATDVDRYRSEDHSVALRYYAPHVVVYVKSYNTSTGKKSVLSGLDDLHRWYNSFVATLDNKPSEQMEQIVKSLKAEGDTEIDMVRKIFYWVQDNIQYIAFEDGMRGFIPNSGAFVCEKRYGDCKDMANLIVSMLRAAGIKGYHTWIGTRDLPYKYTDVPTPLVDNHMIATYISGDGQYYFLDGTSSYTAFGYPSSMIQGKQALVSFGPDRYEVKEVPVISAAQNTSFDSVTVTLAKGEVKGTGRWTMNGFHKVFGSYRMDRSEDDKVREYLVGLIDMSSNKFFLDDYKVSNLHDHDKPVVIDYNFRLGDYYKEVGGEIYVNLNLNKLNYNRVIDAGTRFTPYESEYEYTREDHYTLIIPEGYKIEYLPPDAEESHDQFSFSIRYENQGDRVTLTKKFSSNYLTLPRKEFESWNAFVRKLSEAYKESIILSKN